MRNGFYIIYNISTTNQEVIDKAVKLIVEYFEEEGIYEETCTIKKRVLKWYDAVKDIKGIGIKEIAAAAISGNNPNNINWTKEDLIEWRDFYFVDENYLTSTIGRLDEILAEDNLHISELTDAMRDELWQ